MPRIRTVKPEFWSSPDTAKASPLARLTYIAMWNWADDHGRGTLNLKELEGFIFPNDDVSELTQCCENHEQGTSANFRRIVKEVVSVFGLTVYEVDRRTYYAIPSWSDHQRTERKAKSKYPVPEDGKNVSDQWSEGSSDAPRRKLRELPTDSEGSFGKEEHRNRGTGETFSAPSDEPTPAEPEPTEPTPTQNEPVADSLNELAARHFAKEKYPGAYGTPDDPRCAQHVHLAHENVPNCHKCADARRTFQEHAQDAKNQARAERRAAIDACDLCDENGFREIPGGVAKCDHVAEDVPPWEVAQ